MFKMAKIPSDNHIRDMLDPVEPQPLSSAVRGGGAGCGEAAGGLTAAAPARWSCADRARRHRISPLRQDPLPALLDRDQGGKAGEYFHAMLAAPHRRPRPRQGHPAGSRSSSCPQDGHEKQDCESRAAKRWLAHAGPLRAPQADLSRRRSVLPPAALPGGAGRRRAISSSSASPSRIRPDRIPHRRRPPMPIRRRSSAASSASPIAIAG